VTIVRLFNTVGPRQVGRYGMVLPRFVQAAMAGQPLKVHGDGRQTRCFCHVRDVVSALARLMAEPASRGRVFNLGGEEEVSIRDLAAQVITAVGSASRVEHQTYQEAYGQQFDDMPRRVPDLGRIREAIGFSSGFSLDQIIASVVEAHRDGNQLAPRPAGRG
jgi:UDP-glucose 4-epimerase